MPLNTSRMPLSENSRVLCALLVVLLGMGLCAGFAQSQTIALENLEREFTDPLTTLPSFLKRYFLSLNYGTNLQTNQVVARNHSPNPTKYTIAFRPTRSTDFLTGDRSDSRGWYSYRLRRHAIV